MRQQCTIPDCTKLAKVRGLCSMHYNRMLKTGTTDLRTDPRLRPAKPCSIDGCPSNAVAHGVCNVHYSRIKSTGRTDLRMPSERLWAKVNKDGPIPVHCPELGPCWVWVGKSVHEDGYGLIRVRGRSSSAHRLSYELHYGPIPVGAIIRHHCDNPPCCNPAHLAVGTVLDNARDRVSRGRGALGDKNGSRTCPESYPRGEKHHNAKLDADTVRAIRAAREGDRHLSQMAIGQIFNIDQTTISRILLGKVWSHVV